MKYLLVLAVVMVAFWVWRNNRLDNKDTPAPRQPSLRKPTVMVACLDCGMHLPRSEAVMGSRGAYCCAEHRERSESDAP